MTCSTHRVEVLPIQLRPHPNAERLSLVQVHGYQCVTGTADWLARPALDSEGRRLAAWVPPDSTVPVNRPEFAFLAGKPPAADLG